MPKYEFDAVRWLRSQAKAYRRGRNEELAKLFDVCAFEHEQALAELTALKEAAVHIYNSGYHAGHHDTVEGRYVDIHTSDMGTYHTEEVAELLAALVGEG